MIGTLFIFPFQLIAGIIKIDFLTLPVLTSAVKAAGMVETLSSKGPFMLYAPNESAFAKVQKENLDGMLKDYLFARKPYLDTPGDPEPGAKAYIDFVKGTRKG